MIVHNRPHITAEDRAAVDRVLTSGWIAQGPAVAALEDQFVREFAGGGACAVSSGTAALFLALRALGGGTGVTIAVPTFACSALLNAVHMAGGTPRVVDVLADDFCIDAAALAAQGPAPGLVVAVHTFGAAADVRRLQAAGCIVVEDCCQSLGDRHPDRPLGKTGAASIFSFYATKVIAGGQGGLVWSQSDAVLSVIRDYRQHDGRMDYAPRFNLQMTDLQAALAGSQMQRLASIRAKRSAIVNEYLRALPGGLRAQAGLSDPGRLAYRFVLVTPDKSCREALLAHLRADGVGCIVPLERYELLHRYLRLEPGDFPVAERLVDTTLSLPLHVGLTQGEVAHVCEALSRFHP